MEELTITSIGKRILSFVIDSIIVILATIILFFPLNAINTNTSYYKNEYSIYQQEFVNSSLYLASGDDAIAYTKDEEHSYNYDTYSKVLYNYYINYKQEEKDKNYENYWFNTHILGLADTLNRYTGSQDANSYFEYGDDVLALGHIKGSNESIFSYDSSLKVGSIWTINQYFIEEYDTAISDFNNNVMASSEIYRMLTIYSLIPIGASFLLSLIIFSIVIPLANKDHKTIAKMILKQAVVHKDGYRISFGYALLRQVFIVFIEIILGIATIGGMTLISYTCLLLSKQKQSLHDRIVGSVVVNSADSYWYESKQAYLKAMKLKDVENGKQIIEKKY